jgi:hypothetical protein
MARKTLQESNYNILQVKIDKEFSSLFFQTKDYKKAARYQHNYILLRDSLYGEELIQNLMAVTSEYEQRHNDAKIKSQTRLLDLKEAVINRQNLINTLGIITLMLLIFLIIALYLNNKQKKRINHTLEQKVRERTSELRENYLALEKAYKERDSMLLKTSNDIKQPISTINGLYSLAMVDIDKPAVREYLLKIDSTVDCLVTVINKLS